MLNSIIERKALDQQEADKSDPFVYGRVRTHLILKVAQLEDYSVEFHEETLDVTREDGTPIMSMEFPNQILQRKASVARSVRRL